MGLLLRNFFRKLRSSEQLHCFRRSFDAGSTNLGEKLPGSGVLAHGVVKFEDVRGIRVLGARMRNVPVVLGLGLGFGLASTTVLANSEDNESGSGLGDSTDHGERKHHTREASRPDSSPLSDGSVEKRSVANGVNAGASVWKGLGSQKFKIFIGYDPREDLAYEVCKHSILKRSSIPVEIVPIVQSELRKKNLYWRESSPTESTEFSFSRFLTPYLAGFEGWALFIDCDFLYTTDIKELVDLIEDKYAVMCVHHEYAPKETTKMDGALQTTYPRKNWSSMVLYNCGHPKNRTLTPEVVNTQTGAFLHRFTWLDDGEIGEIPYIWNFLVGHNRVVENDPNTFPKAIHYTLGGPWFEAWKDCEFADLWLKEMEDTQKCGSQTGLIGLSASPSI